MEKQQTPSLLSTENLSIGYPKKRLAEDINLSIQQGELIAVIGSNGSGKSTLLKTLIGELAPLQGKVSLLENPLSDYSSQQLAEYISIVLTHTHFSKNLLVDELVALGRHPYTNWLGRLTAEDKEAVKNALQLISIENLNHEPCSNLSDGQLQRVMLARALAQDTALIVLDEPTNHLDLYHKVFVFQLLRKITQQTQKAILFASHEINLALQLCDRIILVNNGQVVQASPEVLIKEGHLTKLFPKDLVRFNPETKNFEVTK